MMFGFVRDYLDASYKKNSNQISFKVVILVSLDRWYTHTDNRTET